MVWVESLTLEEPGVDEGLFWFVLFYFPPCLDLAERKRRLKTVLQKRKSAGVVESDFYISHCRISLCPRQSGAWLTGVVV